ncbi:MAG: NADH-quinone oxidoreductase subunit J, partial [Candidatus Omnitrophica bacterium]|nr:NADH-quinone oxidoreductase subunit J [Candidatus Omnitrophota bacterium]
MSGPIQLLNNLLNNYGLPQDFIGQASFYVIAAFAVISAFGVVTSRNIFHCAIFLAVSLFCIAGVYLFLGAEFL